MSKKIISLIIMVALTPVIVGATEATSTQNNRTQRIENREQRIENRLVQAGTSTVRLENRMENRLTNIERIRTRLASTTASTSEKRVERLNTRLEKQQEQIAKVKERLLNRELKVVEVLTKIADKIKSRIDILTGRGLNMSASLAKLAEANAKINSIADTADKLSTLLQTEVTETNKDSLLAEIKSTQENIRDEAWVAKQMLVDTIKEITKVLPTQNASSTKKATTTN